MDTKEIISNKLKEAFPSEEFSFSEFRGDFIIKFSKNSILPVCQFLKNNEDLQFVLCEDITAIDWAERKNRFSVVYHLFSLKLQFRLRLMVPVDEKECSVDSVCSVWKTANWHERETYDMYGITFDNHPDLRRMYMPEEFEYYPLRKEFPVMGIPGSIPLPKK